MSTEVCQSWRTYSKPKACFRATCFTLVDKDGRYAGQSTGWGGGHRCALQVSSSWMCSGLDAFSKWRGCLRDGFLIRLLSTSNINKPSGSIPHLLFIRTDCFIIQLCFNLLSLSPHSIHFICYSAARSPFLQEVRHHVTPQLTAFSVSLLSLYCWYLCFDIKSLACLFMLLKISSLCWPKRTNPASHPEPVSLSARTQDVESGDWVLV